MDQQLLSLLIAVPVVGAGLVALAGPGALGLVSDPERVRVLAEIGVIFLLVTLVIVALGSVRSLANRTESINALRSMAAAYNTYSADNQQRQTEHIKRLHTLTLSCNIQFVMILKSGSQIHWSRFRRIDHDRCTGQCKI